MIGWLGKGASALLILGLLGAGGCATGRVAEGELRRFVFEEPQMGIPFRLVFHTDSEERAREAAAAAFKRVAELNQILSDYETDSELNRLSQTAGKGMAVPVSDDLWKVLEAAQRMSRASSGAFDITVGSAVGHWRKARREKRLPDPAQLEAALRTVGHEYLWLDPKTRSARLTAPGTKLDLGGIAKGYALGEALKVLQNHGIRRALVSGSGDMAIGDPPPGKRGWLVEVRGYDAPGGPPTIGLLLSNTALGTSGDLIQRLEIDGVRYSHILDPRTGLGLTNHCLVFLTAKDPMTADSLATTLNVAGAERAMGLANNFGAAARVIEERDGQVRSLANRRFLLLTRKSQAPPPPANATP